VVKLLSSLLTMIFNLRNIITVMQKSSAIHLNQIVISRLANPALEFGLKGTSTCTDG